MNWSMDYNIEVHHVSIVTRINIVVHLVSTKEYHSEGQTKPSLRSIKHMRKRSVVSIDERRSIYMAITQVGNDIICLMF